MGSPFNPKKRIASFGYAFKGIWTLLSTQFHAWLHLIATIAVITAGLYFDVEAWEWVALILSIGLVWMAEGVNTAIEFLTDLASPEYHPLAGKAKDVAAGAVLLAAFAALGVAGVIFGPRIWTLCGG